MISIRNTAGMTSTLNLLGDNMLKELLTQRLSDLSEWEGYDLADLTHFLIMQAGDTAADAENELTWSLLHNVVDGERYGDPDFTPSWEWIEDHSGWFEAVFIISDDGFGISLFVQDHPDTDAELLAMCREYTSMEQL